jgi:hypothetical protein
MRNLLALVAICVIAFLVIGWYCEWYSVRRLPGEPGRNSYNIDVDGRKIRSDVERGVREGSERVNDFLERYGPAEAESHGQPKTQAAPAENYRRLPDSYFEGVEESELLGRPRKPTR